MYSPPAEYLFSTIIKNNNCDSTDSTSFYDNYESANVTTSETVEQVPQPISVPPRRNKISFTKDFNFSPNKFIAPMHNWMTRSQRRQ